MTAAPPQRPIGVFDSGLGGLSVLQSLRAELPGEDYVYLADSAHAPYGERGDAYVTQRTLQVARELRERHRIKALVVACNTATTAAIHLLREAHPDLPLIGVEPAVKPALAASRTGCIGVIGTRGTLGSAKFRALLAPLQAQAEFRIQPCDGLAHAIEAELLPAPQSESKVIALCLEYTKALGIFGTEKGQIDTLVIGCTHYVFAQSVLRKLLGPDVQLLDTGAPVARQTQRLLAQNGLLRAPGSTPGTVQLTSTGDLALLQRAALGWLGLASHQPVLA
ncbi:glutamate racemase [Xylophilus sp. ASV27]|uniref:glutamate racemase n=1 Tax=Xylophilus sp. ASV27 TaxID=2795129 RepID=UPI0018EDF874|nr:glutamate racemase [Xylophilus sp. ASV27]